MVHEYLERDVKIGMLLRGIKDCSNEGIPALREALVSYAWEKWACARRTALEYLRTLENHGDIVVDGYECWSTERWAKIMEARNLDYKKMEDILWMGK